MPGLYVSDSGLPAVRIVARVDGRYRWRPDSWDEGTILSEAERLEAFFQVNEYRLANTDPPASPAKPDTDEADEPVSLEKPRRRNIGPRGTH